MLQLRPMRDDEFAGWRAENERSYVEERTAAGEPVEIAQRVAAEQFADYFPGGRPGERHEVLVGELDGSRVGIVWAGPHPRRPEDPTIAWIYDIYVDEPRRGQGLGRELLDALERHLAAQGVAELSLNVFGDNARARGLYATAGYREVAITMTKPLGEPSDDPR
jgi:ribosomal protein S18 acetylase RimI-like enzyme